MERVLLLLLVTSQLGITSTSEECKSHDFTALSDRTLDQEVGNIVRENCPFETPTTYNCSGINLTDVPRNLKNYSFCNLCISKNQLTALQNGSFQDWNMVLYIDLSDNWGLDTIEANAFEGLSKLLALNLKGTKINEISNEYSFSEAFQHLSNLIVLDMTKMSFKNYDMIGKAVKHTMNLSYVGVEGCINCSFREEFSLLKNLVLLDQTGEKWNFCYIGTLVNEYFINVSSLQEVYLSDCFITKIEPDAFAPLTSLSFLDLSYNYNLTFDGLENIKFPTNIKTLYLNYIYPLIIGLSRKLTKNQTKFLDNLNLKEIHLAGNSLEAFDEGLLSSLPKTIEVVNLRKNRLIIDYYIDELLRGNGSLPNLASLDISDQHSASPDHQPQTYHLSRHGKRTKRATASQIIQSLFVTFVPVMAFPKKLKRLVCSREGWNFPLPEIRVVPNNNLKHIDLSQNLLRPWIGPIKGLEKLDNLSLAHNFCGDITEAFFSHFTGLKRLEIQGNYLGDVLSQDAKGMIFRSLTKLKYLDISHNIIAVLPPLIFNYMTSLEELVISYNMLSEWEIDMGKMSYVRKINMSYNRLEMLPSKFSECTDTNVESQPNKSIEIDLTGNPLSCLCNSLSFMKWLVSTKANVSFNLCGTNSKSQVADKLKSLEKECMSKIGVITGCTLTIMLFLCILFGGLIHRYKWHLRYLYYSARNTYGKSQARQNYQELHEYDAFVSYVHDDKQFICDSFIPNLEEKYNIKLCFAERDFTPGLPIPENIVRAITSSRRAVFVLSKDFLHSYWCKYELNMARMESERKNRRFVIVVIYGDVPHDELPLEIMEVIRSQTYIRYPCDESAVEAFWERLKECLN